MNETIVDFGGTDTGAEGILVTANAFTVKDLALENTAGDGIEDAVGVHFIRTCVEWANPQNTSREARPGSVSCDRLPVDGEASMLESPVLARRDRSPEQEGQA